MNNIISPRTRALIAQSIEPVEARRTSLKAALGLSLQRSRHDPELSDRPELVATILVDFLIEQARHAIVGGQPRSAQVNRAEHQLNGIDGRHYSRFGDSLVPVLRDTLGGAYPPETAAAWSDAYWAFVSSIRDQEGRFSGRDEDLLTAELVA